jgi:MFS family permease
MFKKLGLEGWFSAHFAYGLVQIVFIPVTIPAFILARTGSATQAGMAMGLFGLAGLFAPLIGMIADKFQAYRSSQALGLITYLLAGLCFVASGEDFTLMAVGSVLFGTGSAILLMLNPVFITFAGYDDKTEATKLGRMAQILILGSLIAGVGFAFVTDLGWSYEARFMLMMAIVALLLVVTMATNKQAAQRILDNAEARAKQAALEADAPKVNILKIVFSNFGLFMLAVLLLCAGQGAFQAQFPNLMENAYGISQSMSTATLSVTSVVGIFLLFATEKYIAARGPISLFKLCAIISIVVIGGLFVIASGNMQLHYLIVLTLVMVYLQGITVTDMVCPAIASRLTPVGGGYTQGLMMFYISLGFGFGGVVSGIAVDCFGWASLPLAIGGLSALSLVCILIVGAKAVMARSKA